MNSLETIVARVQELTIDPEMAASQKNEHIKICIKSFATDVLNLYTNIEKTSLNEEDKTKRVEELCNTFDLSLIGNKFY